ncbi:bifunctional diguanylate cyclase/phosphodiesterase [Metabacillus malikii]|uniref:Diguanylate cyclase (GGDEF)-like protein/PAS domain S-box-containing protein n=1 Tax=Metabacillus malikii TaxID=1504265 RepID=A0ABT9ZB01_9BACI|nr:EAL domain-containing protein [Metabacillus malikii]MDQ0229437.1 diguanylate cyclase (GGDEF)-like protein/PAS domain S-box-containing protein [Metabacillus malikii]
MINEHTRYSRLAQITKLINSKLELKELLDHVVIAISEEVFRCDSVGIYLPQEDGTYRGYVGKPYYLNGMTLDTLVIDPKSDLLAREILDTKDSIYIPDTSIDERPDFNPIQKFNINSLFALPINYDNEVYGLVFLFNQGKHMDLTLIEMETVEAYVNMAAVAIRNAKLLKRKESLITEKQLMLDITKELSLCLTKNDSIEKCFTYLGKILKNTNIAAHLVDPLSPCHPFKPLRIYNESQWTQAIWKKAHKEIIINECEDDLIQLVLQTKKAIYIPDVNIDTRPNKEICKYFNIKGLLMLPIVTMGNVLGIIIIWTDNNNHTIFSDTDIALAQSIVEANAAVLSHLTYMDKQEQIINYRTKQLTNKNNELKTAVQKLQQLSREKELILNSVGDGIIGMDIKGSVIFCNPAAEACLRYKPNQLIGKSYKTFFSRSNTSIQQLSFLKNVEQTTYFTDEKFIRFDNTEFPVEYGITSIKDKAVVVGYVLTFKDVTYRKQMEEQINYHAYYDSLTDLPNRLLFQDRLEQGLAYAQLHNEMLAILFLDIDRFKTINDTLGHKNGDLLLQKVAERLVNCSIKGSTVARQGGDEFALILPLITSEEEVERITGKILTAFKQPVYLKGIEIFVKISIGISLFPQDGLDAEELISKADMALTKSKEMTGIEYHFYRSTMVKHSLETVKLEHSLYRALDLNEFQIYYQPQIDTRQNELFGVEALLRWRHREKGMISPAHFIPIAEETGLIIPIGEWMLQHVCHQIKAWQDKGYPSVTVSLNISASQFNKTNFVETVKKVIVETDITPSLLELELTESLIIHNSEDTLNKMSELRELGVHLSIDDFGTGYSSLGYLMHFPIHTLKIDRSFLKDICTNKKNAAITNTIISLAENLEVQVIAEGVETKEQLIFLTSNNCYRIQGFYFSAPLSVDVLEEKYFYNV